MTRRKKQPGSRVPAGREDAGARDPEPSAEAFIPELSDEKMGELMAEKVMANLLADPEAAERYFRELDKWRDDFVAEHGREPDFDDFEKAFLDDITEAMEEAFEESAGGECDSAEGDDWDEYEGCDDDVKAFMGTCGWCGAAIAADDPRYGFGIKLKVVFDRGPEAPRVLRWPLVSAAKEIPLAVSQPGSDALKEGYDLLVQTCSLECGEACKAALEEDQRIGHMGLVN
jgi:hypothetical protein